MDELNSEKTVFQEISEGLDEIELGTQSVMSRAYLSWFGFKGQSQQAKVRVFVSNTHSIFLVLVSKITVSYRIVLLAKIHIITHLRPNYRATKYKTLSGWQPEWGRTKPCPAREITESRR